MSEFHSEFCFRSIFWEQIDRISPNFRYAFILTRSMVGLLGIIFHSFVTEFWSWLTSEFHFHSINWEQIDRILSNFICAFILTRWGLLSVIFSSPEPKAPRWAISIPVTPASVVRPSVHQHFQTSSPLKPLCQLNSNFIWRLLRIGERKFVQMVPVTWPRWPPCPYMVKTL